MSAGLAALLDDIAVLARAAAASVDDIGAAAAKAGSKAAGVVIDDAAVTPQYVRGLAAEREIPIVKRIAIGSLRNKFLFILPVILVLSQFLDWLLTPLLMIGGAYLCYEGAEKIWERIAHHDAHAEAERPDEKTLVSGAIRTDLILSAEIMVISLNEVADQSFWSRTAILAVVAVAMTVLVYGAVGLIVKMDDVGLRLAERPGRAAAGLGRGLVKAMPRVLAVLSIVGTAAMLWVGGHILLVGADELGLHAPYEVVHHLEEAAHDATGALGGVVGWLVNTLASAIVGLIVGAVVVAVMSVTFHRSKSHAKAGAADGHAHDPAAPADPAATHTGTAGSAGSGAAAHPGEGGTATGTAGSGPAHTGESGSTTHAGEGGATAHAGEGASGAEPAGGTGAEPAGGTGAEPAGGTGAEPAGSAERRSETG